MTHAMVDLASFQGQVTEQEVQALKYVGVEAAYVKATQGDYYVNPDANQQVHALRAAGFKVGLYHFFDPKIDVTKQVQQFLIVAQTLGGSDLPVGVDVEQPGISWEALAWQIVSFAMQVEHEPTTIRSATTIFYVNLTYARSLSGFPWGRAVWLADPNPGAPHFPCLVLQGAPRPLGPFSSIDPDHFLGTEEQWQAFTSGSVIPPSAAPQPSSTPPKPAPVPAPAPLTPAEEAYLKAVHDAEVKAYLDAAEAQKSQDALNALEGKPKAP